MNVIQNKLDEKHVLARMIAEPEVNFVGNVFKLTYEYANILTNDYYKERVQGIPLNSFLIGATYNPSDFSSAKEHERSVVLFRMISPIDLPGDDDKVRTLIEHYQSKSQIYSDDSRDGIEPITHNWLQFGGLQCEILGSFYMDNNKLKFGADIEDFQSMSSLKVYKPSIAVLGYIVNYIDPIKKQKMEDDSKLMGFANVPEPFHIGHLRYTSTYRLQKLHKEADVEVRVQPTDFLARRTAIFGMTRTGKSNTVKTTISAVAMAASKAQIRIGQLIFDMNGEYANANGQDSGSSINEVFTDNVVRYRGIETEGFFDLRDNFYESHENGIEIIRTTFEKRSNLSGSVERFLTINLTNTPPEESDEKTRWYRTRTIYHLLLANVGFETRYPLKLKFKCPKEIWTIMYDILKDMGEFKEVEGELPTNENGRIEFMKEKFGDPDEYMDQYQMHDFLMVVRRVALKLKDNHQTLKTKKSSRPWLSDYDLAMLNLIASKNDTGAPINTSNLFTDALKYHAAKGNNNIKKEVYNHLSEGRIVILDLSVGLQSVKANMSEKIAQYILDKNSEVVNQNKPAVQCVLYVEEAHNLIGKTNKLDETWPRVAKEGAKFGIALVYATQEPSSVHPNILANTENLFVTHLNNDDEIKALSKYYDFKSFASSLKKAQDVGFARIKTLSSHYVIPTQIKKFEPDVLKTEYVSLKRPGWFKTAPIPVESNSSERE